MGLKDWITKRPKELPVDLTFGRFTDLYKPQEKYTDWDLAIQSANNDDHVSTYGHIFDYLTDANTSNMSYTKDEDGNYSFQFYQGSKLVEGFTDQHYFIAKVKIAKCLSSNLTVFRKILEENYNLQYSKYCLDDDHNLCLIFESSHLDANPYKLFYGLKELATLADHRDDVLTESYNEFTPLNTDHLEPVDSYILTAKYEYFIKETKTLLRQINTNNLTLREHLGSLSYLVCSYAFKMDYLLVPEGKLMQSLEALISLASTNDSQPINENISKILKILHTFEEYPENDFQSEFYKAIYTFGVTTPVDHKHIIHLIESNIEQLKWYVSKGDAVLASAVCSFIIGKLFYENAVPAFERELMHLYYCVKEATFFSTCGFQGLVKNQKIKKKDVLTELNKINDLAKEEYLDFDMNTDMLMWDLDTFGPSFAYMVSNITYTSKK